MNCREVLALLDDFVDGTLPEQERTAVARHLEVCPECRTSDARMRALLAKVGALPHSIAPQHDPWPSIAERIMTGKVVEFDYAGRSKRWYLLGAAAVAAAVLIAAVSLVTALLVRSDRESRVALAPRRPTTTVATPASLDLAQAQVTYAAARKQLLAALDARKRSLSPQTLAVVERNLKIIDEAVVEMQTALARDPGNRELPALLVTAYQQEIDLLQRVTQLPGRG
jgi:anti-sigma factor RsiW